MSEHDKLLERLMATARRGYEPEHIVAEDAAAAIREQAARIAELEAQNVIITGQPMDLCWAELGPSWHESNTNPNPACFTLVCVPKNDYAPLDGADKGA